LEADEKIIVPGQPGKEVHKIPISKEKSQA
jgi:hypothetical protein